jgi:hypothetical protein
MHIPGFTAEDAIYNASVHYRFSAYIRSSGDVHNAIYPQGCPWYEWIVCAAKVSACTTGCSTAGSFAWLPCMAQCLFLIGAAPCLRCVT